MRVQLDLVLIDALCSADAGQEPSITSTNNFINFCLQFPDKAKTNGQQVLEGSCNQTPMGVIVAQAKMPAAKFQNPANGETIPANKDFTLSVLIRNMELGHFTNPNTAYHMAPQQVNAQGNIKGHSHIVIEQLAAIDSTTPTDPTKFAFFKGLNDKDQGGVLTADVAGLPAGVYRMASINTARTRAAATLVLGSGRSSQRRRRT